MCRINGKDYYPFGMIMPGKNFNNSDYPFGFNGQEKVDEVKGVGNQLDFKYRGYDPRLGKFLSIDPLTKKYPELTPYQFAGNTPIWAKELEGLESWYTNSGSTIPEGDGPQRDQSGPLATEHAKDMGYEQYGENEAKKVGEFSQNEIDVFSKWNSSNRKNIEGSCLGTAVRGAEKLTGSHAGFDTPKGNLNLIGKNAFDLGTSLEVQGFSTEIQTKRGSETQTIINNSGNTNGNYSAYLAGPGGAYHSMIVVYKSDDVKFSIYDQGSGWDVKNAGQAFTQQQFAPSNEGRGPSRMWQLFKQEFEEKKYPIDQ